MPENPELDDDDITGSIERQYRIYVMDVYGVFTPIGLKRSISVKHALADYIDAQIDAGLEVRMGLYAVRRVMTTAPIKLFNVDVPKQQYSIVDFHA